ncbi:MAG: hypothetical protein L6V85_06420 [Clostridiales bacterium]|nr:MAG: hypothetical protein L6V85_06420 [Clostridiales bacterium]
MRRKFTIRILQKGDAKGASGFEYSIAINKYIVNDKDIFGHRRARTSAHDKKTAKKPRCQLEILGKLRQSQYAFHDNRPREYQTSTRRI